MGGSSSNGSSVGAVEAPNTLISNSRIKILDLIGEGTQDGFWPQTGVSGSNMLCSVYLDDVPLMNGDGSFNYNATGAGFSFGYTSGTSGQGVLPGYNRVEALIPLPANTRVTNPPPNNGYPRPVVASFNTAMYPDAEAIKVTVRFPAVYTVDSKNGNTNGFDISWAVDISRNGGPFVLKGEHSLSDIASSPKCTSPYVNTQIYQLLEPGETPAEFYEWKVRVRRVSQNVVSTNTQNEMFVDSMAVVSSNSYRYPMSAIVGLELSADQFGAIPTRAYDVKGIKVLVPEGYTPTQYNQTIFTRQCDYDAGNKLIGMTTQSADQVQGISPGTLVTGPGIPNGTVVTEVDYDGPVFTVGIDKDPTSTEVNTALTFTSYTYGTVTAATYPSIWTGTWGARQWTDNPAWIFYDLCTNKRYGLGNYIRQEWVDKWTLYSIAQYCDELVDDGNGGLEPRFTCNVAIQTPQDAYTLLNNLVSVFRGMLYWSNGRIFPVGSETRDPVFNFTNANVIGGAFSYSDSPRSTRATVCTIRWNDPANLFRPTPERLEDPDGIAKYGVIEKNITAFATTSRGQAMRAANWILTVEQQLTETIQFQTDLEGLYLRPGDVFNVYDNFRNNMQQGGRIADFSTGRDLVVLDRNVVLETGFEYYLAATVPAANFMATGDVTGSNQIGIIRNSQIETRRVTSVATPSTNTLEVNSGFSENLYRGSVWVMSASGNSITVFDKATQYKVLSTSEPSKGVVQVLGVEYQTGVNYLVNNNYSVVTNPPVEGDTTPPLPPTGFATTRVSGLLNNNTFFSYLYLGWQPSPSTNTSYYRVSGQLNAGAPFDLGDTFSTGLQYVPDTAGSYSFYVAAYNANGYGSAFTTGAYAFPNVNPLGTTSPLSGVLITENFDPYSFAPAPLSRYTGYIGTQPTFTWTIADDTNNPGVETPTAQFISGYRIRLLNITNEASNLLANDIIVAGKANTSYTPAPGFLYTGASLKPLRAFTFSVDTIDDYGNVASGARLAVNNIQLRPPVTSGFVGFNGGVSYTVTPPVAADVSGVYVWVNASPSFTPTFTNNSYYSSNLAGFAPAPDQGSFYTWFALSDTYGPSGSIAANGDYNARIYGPISGNANQAFGEFALSIEDELDQALVDISGALNDISGAFNLITGNITNSLNVISGEALLGIQSVNALSGQVVGLPGAANTALNVRVNTIVVSSSGALSQQIDAVRAETALTGQLLTAQVGTVSTALTNTGVALGQRIDVVSASVQTTGQLLTAQVATVSTALTNTGVALGQQITVVNANLTGASGVLGNSIGATGATLLQAQVTSDAALASWITNLGVQTTGTTAAVRIGAEALITGSINGLGGAAVARWGFELDANGKVVSMKATSSQYGSSYGTIVFGNASLQSDTYTAGTTGWQIRPDGSTEFNNIQARGTLQSYSFTAGSAGWRIQANGNAEFNNISARGAFTGGTASDSLAIIDSVGMRIGNPSSQRVQIGSAGTNRGIIDVYNQDNNIAARLAYADIGGGQYPGYLELYGDGATNRIGMIADGSSYIMRGSNSFANIPLDYAFRVGHMTNSTNKYGMVVATNWQAIENRILTVGSVDAATNNLYERFVIYGEGTVTNSGDINAASFNTTSSRRFKENIQPLGRALQTIHSLTGVTFDWKSGHVTSGHDFGLIAEEVASVLPTAVSHDPNGLVRGVDYGRLSAVLIEAVKDLSNQVKELKAQRP
jgi:hypothetical protein